MFNELKENTDSWLNKVRKMMHEQNENTNKETEIIKKNVTEILEVKNTINDLKKFTRGVQLHTWTGK